MASLMMMRQENNTHFYKKGNTEGYNIPSEKALKSKDLNVAELLGEKLVQNPRDPGYVDLRLFDVYEIVEDYPTQTAQQRKRVIEKIQEKYLA
jgi:hypothetical protein